MVPCVAVGATLEGREHPPVSLIPQPRESGLCLGSVAIGKGGAPTTLLATEPVSTNRGRQEGPRC